jgi:hypothetical protein
VRHQQRFARREHLLIDLQLAWVVREQHDDASGAATRAADGPGVAVRGANGWSDEDAAMLGARLLDR